MEHLPGFREFYPEPLPASEGWSAEVRQYLFATWREVARRHGFREYDGPPLEPLELFTAKSGDEIVGQLYHFVDKGDRAVALRPEMTPTLARMVAAQARHYRKPIRWFAIPQLFRYERQQKGRLREHFQLNADIFGEPDPAADAELVALLIAVLRAVGLTEEDFVVRLSSRQAWHEFFSRRTTEPLKEYEFYQVVDKLEREDPDRADGRLRALGFDPPEVRAFVQEGAPTPELQRILDNLAARGLSAYVQLDYGVIRGLAYYTGPVFEAFDRKGEFRAVAGGGRYDQLVKLLSGGRVDLPGLGFGLGDVVLTELLRARGRLSRPGAAVAVFVLIENESLRPASLGLIQTLRDQGWSVDYSFTPAKADKQFRRALELEAGHTVRLERGEDGGVRARIRHLATRSEVVVDPAEVVAQLERGKRGHEERGAPSSP